MKRALTADVDAGSDRSPDALSRVQQVTQRPHTLWRHLGVASAGDHPDELDSRLLVRRQLVPRSHRGGGQGDGSGAHLPKIPRSTTRDRVVRRGSLWSEASRISSSQPRSFSETGVPKTSTMAFAAVTPTDCSSDSRIR